ncbi:MAG: TonB-dependent receptor [Deltaproteobacteria bacterium]|nr:TonB-dependent receptor [Deltaproteobacteria bacterium]
MRDSALVLSVLLALASVLLPSPAAAQSDAEEEERQPVVVPPRLEEFVEATYPPAAQEAQLEATVELQITIAVDGSVTDASVVEPKGNGFDEAALEAVRRFRFSPATVDGTPTPVRIRYRYEFTLDEPEPEEELPPEEEEERPGRLEGRVLTVEDDEPVAGAEVVLTNADQSIARRTVAAEDGSFRMDELPPGEYQVRILGAEYGDQTQTETVGAGEVTEVVYRLRSEAEQVPDDELSFGATAVVEAPPREVTRRSIGREQLTSIPGTRGDALRAVEILPGVARPAFGSGALIVRGAAPGDSQAFLEGIPIPLLYHFGGLTSFIQSRLLERVDFYPGNFSVRYGRKMGGVLEVETRDPRGDGLHGVAELSVIDVGLLAEFPLGENASGAFGIRRSMIDVVFNNVIPEDLEIGVSQLPVYYDWQAFVTWRPTDRDKVKMLAYGSSDRFEIFAGDSIGDDPDVRGDVSLTTRFNFFHLNWNRQIDSRSDVDIDLQYGPVRLNFGLGDLIEFDLLSQQVYTRMEYTTRPTSSVRLIAGLDAYVSPFTLDYTGPAPCQGEGGNCQTELDDTLEPLSFDGVATRPGIYLESAFDLAPTRLVIGLRTDYDSTIDRWNVDPRFSGFLDVGGGFKLKTGLGLYSQPPEFQESAEVIGNPNLDWIHSVHTGLGVEYENDALGIEAGVEGFYKYLWDRVVGTENGVPPRFINDGIGRIYGMEVSFRHQMRREIPLFLQLSYTLMRSERRDDPSSDEDWRLFDFDQTHIFTLAASYRLPKNWEVGAAIRIISGNPYTPIVTGIYNEDRDTYLPVYGANNSVRNPLYHRLDLRVEKKWKFSSWMLALFLDIRNVYNQQNQEGLIYSNDYRQSTRLTGLPIIPALGIRGEL